MHEYASYLSIRHNNAGWYAIINDLSSLVAHLCHNRNTVIAHDDVIKWKHYYVTDPLCGEFTGHRWIPRTKASDAKLWCFLWSAPGLNKRLGKQSRGWWFETPSRILWRHCIELHYVSGNMHIIVLLYGRVILNTFLELSNSLCKMLLGSG